MSLAILKSRALCGMNALSVHVEVHLANGLPALNIIGLPDTEVREAKDRVRAALQNAGFTIPARRITVNLAPADQVHTLIGTASNVSDVTQAGALLHGDEWTALGDAG